MTNEEVIITLEEDRPKGGMWHCGPNPCWVTVKHIPTGTMARAYHRSQHKAREIAVAAVELMIGEDAPGLPENACPDANLEAELAKAISGYTRLLNEKLRGEWRDDLEAKLAKAVGAITCILATAYSDDHVGWQTALDDARTALKELEAKP